MLNATSLINITPSSVTADIYLCTLTYMSIILIILFFEYLDVFTSFSSLLMCGIN